VTPLTLRGRVATLTREVRNPARRQPTPSVLGSSREGTDVRRLRISVRLPQRGPGAADWPAALVVLGLPVMTADYDFWLHIDDIEAFNACPTHLTCCPHSARTRPASGPLCAGERRTRRRADFPVHANRGGPTVTFDEMWARRQAVPLNDTTMVTLPSVRDLILTKRFAARPKDLEDIRLIEITFKDQLP